MSRSLQLVMILSAPLAMAIALLVLWPRFFLSPTALDYVVRFDLPDAAMPVDLPRVDGPADASRPLVVIDAGHGGFDPGAGQGDVREKTVALRIALALRNRLLEEGGIRVALTRDADRFIGLPDRPDIARRLGADLFVSIHADSAESDAARGASVYVLSEKGSSEAAERFAARENAAGRINGVALGQTSETVGAILLDLSQRGTQAGSAQVGELVLRELRGANLGLHREEVQTAALAVLKAPDIPSILFETGYINNKADAELLTSRAGQQSLADAAARAIRAYFARKGL
ncbi:MAG: N-acetylmuramoyl-L-alanine amidase [Novosphingobium lindaniclasticum]|jgi:N-acetylmuramoyl-L-alanine amidase|uniref:N-acetylmuramoyl-L-alanine amidase family protein n=1 Tax=Novosphingobium lindaniclasticum TaxID=1329895 RepID=UPI002409C660|nr:N-acetylmuramoyl-L-alanine amidase [Novosphingobium lindaniclasticum]MDF2638907.1 N-acetylmuramoyl-L-alanine amidase [Novosphingobium lindaniclasticum]